MSVVVVLTAEQVAWAEDVGNERERRALARGYKPRHGTGLSIADDPWETHREGAAGELAFALATGREWRPSLDPDRDIGDVEGTHVRATKYHSGHLILHPEDREGVPFVLCTGIRPRLTLRGWCWIDEGREDRYWRTDIPWPAFLVPQRELRPFNVDRRDHSLDRAAT